MKKKSIIALIAVLLICLGGFYVLSSKKPASNSDAEITVQPSKESNPASGSAFKDIGKTPQITTDVYKNWLVYPSKKYGFEIKFPITWDGYTAKEVDGANYNYTGFSFGAPHQPFTIFQIISYTPQQWQAVKNKQAVKVLYEGTQQVLVCDGCCGISKDYTGGGQFDKFQQARCNEAMEIMKTFKMSVL